MLLSHIALHSQQDIMRVNVSAQKNTEHSFVQYSWTGYGGALQRVPSMIRVERERKKKESRVMWTLQSVNAFLLFQNKILRGWYFVHVLRDRGWQINKSEQSLEMKYILAGSPYGPLGFSGYSYGYGLNAQPLYAFLPLYSAIKWNVHIFRLLMAFDVKLILIAQSGFGKLRLSSTEVTSILPSFSCIADIAPWRCKHEISRQFLYNLDNFCPLLIKKVSIK